MANFDDDDFEIPAEEQAEVIEEAASPGSGSNRNFLLGIGLLGGLFVLLLIALGGALIVRNQMGRGQVSAQVATNAVIETQNALNIAQATQAQATVVMNAQILTATSMFAVTDTPVPPTMTNTPVVAKPTFTDTVSPDEPTATFADARTATVAALLTQAAVGNQQTLTVQAATLDTTPGASGGGSTGGTNQTVVAGAGTSTALPATGFADDVGLPGMFGLAMALVLVIMIARRLRLSSTG
jgi:hypothetical protein